VQKTVLRFFKISQSVFTREKTLILI
jgi:hypothetical protein